MRLRVFLQFFFFSNIVSACFYYIIHVVSFVQETLEKRLSSCQNVWFCYCTEINIVIYVLYTKQRICGRWAVPGVGNCLFLPARGWEIDRQVRKKLQIPMGMPGGMVTGRIEPCITRLCFRTGQALRREENKAMKSFEGSFCNLNFWTFSFHL